MKQTFKRFLTTPFVCLILIISLLAFPMGASAEAGTLGHENPKLTCVFTDANGKKADGNRLKPGKYSVDIVLSGMKAFSVFELTATYTDRLSSVVYKSSYATNNSGIIDSGCKIENNTVAIVQVAESEDACAIDTNGTVMVSLSVTVASSCDFVEAFAFSTNPDLCFVMASYLDGLKDCYVLDTSVKKDYKTHQMTADASPEFVVTEFDVNGTVTIAGDTEGTSTEAPASGINVSVLGTDKSAVTQADGSYKLTELAEGEYTLLFSGAHTIDRTVKLVVSADKANYDQLNVADIGICVLDYNKDGKVNSTDVALFSKYKNDLNNDNLFNELDFEIFRSFLGKPVAYTQLTLN